MKRLETRVPPPILGAVIAVAMCLWAWPGPAVGWRDAVAAVLVVAAGGLAAPAFAAFRRAGTTVNPVHVDAASRLVTGGVYRISRNPMYVSLTLLLCALALHLADPMVWAGPAIFVLWITRFQIIPEERAMAARFGADYARYRAGTRRWL